MRILVTNDDGITSIGIAALAHELSKSHEVYVVAPETQLSSIGGARTYSRPIRMWRWDHGPYGSSVKAYVVDGTPADAVFVGVEIFKPDIVVSGINLGENVGLESLFISGTLNAAIQAALMGIPGIAASVEVPPMGKFSRISLDENYFSFIARLVKEMLNNASSRGWPSDIDVISINMPSPNRWRGEYAVTTKMSRKLFKEMLIKSTDPRGGEILWRWGNELSDIEEGSDAYLFYIEAKLTITPISLSSFNNIEKHNSIRELTELIDEAMHKAKRGFGSV